MSQELHDLKATIYDIVDAPAYDELFEFFKRHESMRIWLFNNRRGHKFSVAARITSIKLNPTRAERFRYTAVVMPAGRWIRVEGAFMYDAPGRMGTMQVVPQKHCDWCHVAVVTLDARCERCGRELRTGDIPPLDPVESN